MVYGYYRIFLAKNCKLLAYRLLIARVQATTPLFSPQTMIHHSPVCFLHLGMTFWMH